ncbi:MAG: twin-arginine translocase TatA/TatE family subunit [Synergistaceae bacterium]|jgi:sec-independent protein translocase protein TatA|nr:twin-arginine translocase TatA/TatE family subunit [Synergistaceae bacterium]
MNIGMGEVVLLIVLALVLFGAKRLPEVGRAAGSAIREFKSALNGAELNGAALNGAEPGGAEPHKAEAKGGENV